MPSHNYASPQHRHGNKSQLCFTLGGILLQADIKQSVPIIEEFGRLEIPFCGSCSDKTRSPDVTMTFTSDGTAADQGQLLFKEDGIKIFETSDSFLIQRFSLGNGLKPFLSITINPQYTNFNFSFDWHRYKKVISNARQASISIFHYVTYPSLLFPALLNESGLSIHAGGGTVQGKGMLFAAPSGTGKSTLCRLLNGFQSTRLFSEERIIVRRHETHWKCWGTPWHGEGDIARNECAPLDAVIFLSQAKKTRLSPLTPAKALHRLLQVVSIPLYSREWTEMGLALCEHLIRDTPMYELCFTPDRSAPLAIEQLVADL